MSTNVVNLDALIPREDLGVISATGSPNTVDKITLPHLDSFVFAPDLRKPQFQRETNQWTPKKVVDLLVAFVDHDLIPAVILWRAGQYIFVVDGAHRLSALLAWVHNDYGDGPKSQAFFSGHIPDEQRKVADRTRKLVDKTVGSYKDYEEARKGIPKSVAIMSRLDRLSDCLLIAQWVPTADPKSAEASFFKINQAATPIDPTERRLLKARDSASAIAARAITNSGSGHKYWSKFGALPQANIEEQAKVINGLLYLPPIDGTPLNTLDVPVAGQGYNSLPFVFDLVNEVNNIGAADTTNKKGVADNLPDDPDGALTIAYLSRVRKALSLITTDESASLGLHPVVWFYARGGSFKPEAFFAAYRFVCELEQKSRLKNFTNVRSMFENYLVDHKEALALIVHRFGTGNRSIPWLVSYYNFLFEQFDAGKTAAQVTQALASDQGFSFLTAPPPGAKSKAPGKKPSFSSGIKTAAYFAQALSSCVCCGLCGARIHKNSMHIDHIQGIAHGGHAGLTNAHVVHPYCDSIKASWTFPAAP